MDNIQRQSIDQNLPKLAKSAGFSDIYAQDYSGYLKDFKDYIYLNGEKYRPQDISPINIFSFVNLKNEVLAFLGWPYYNLEKLTILYAMFKFIVFLFSLLKGIYNTCAIHTKVNKQACVARIFFAGFFGIFSSLINKILLDDQIKEYNTKLSTNPNTYDDSNNNTNALPTAPQLPNNHPLSLVSRYFRNIAITNPLNSRPSHIQSPIQHIVTQEPSIDDTYEQISEQPHTTTFQSQNNHFLGHNEQTSWITPPIKLPPCQPPKSTPFYPTFFRPPDSTQANTSSGMNSDTNSDITIYTTYSKHDNSDIETPDEFADSEPSPSTHTPTSSTTFSKPPFQTIQSHSQHTSPYTPSQVTPTYSPFNNERSTNNSPDNI